MNKTKRNKNKKVLRENKEIVKCKKKAMFGCVFQVSTKIERNGLVRYDANHLVSRSISLTEDGLTYWMYLSQISVQRIL